MAFDKIGRCMTIVKTYPIQMIHRKTQEKSVYRAHCAPSGKFNGMKSLLEVVSMPQLSYRSCFGNNYQ